MDNNDQSKPSEQQQPVKVSYTIAPNNELRVRYVNKDIMRRLFNVAHKNGCTATQLVKMHLKDILALYPENYQNDKL